MYSSTTLLFGVYANKFEVSVAPSASPGEGGIDDPRANGSETGMVMTSSGVAPR